MNNLVDTHCHLDFETFDSDRDQVVERAIQTGVSRILIPSITLENAFEVIQLAGKYPQVYAAVGVHPNSALSWTQDTAYELRRLAKRPKVVAIGEIGLDYYRDRAPRELQREIFLRQLAIAQEAELPVIIHTRDGKLEDDRATQDVIELLAEWMKRLAEAGSPLLARPGVLHSYTGSFEAASQAMEMGFYIGITGPVTFRNAPELQQLVARLPMDRILVETDAPFLTPHPFRGKRNEPAHVGLVTDKIASIFDLPVEIVAEAITSNAERLFHW